MPELLAEDTARAHQLGLELAPAPSPAPLVEARRLLERLYGEPPAPGRPNPHLAPVFRLRATTRDGQSGSVDIRHWPDLGLGYIESVRVSPSNRRRGLGDRLIRFALDYLHRHGCRQAYAYAATPEGLRLLTRAGFQPQPPDDATTPWRCWVSCNLTGRG